MDKFIVALDSQRLGALDCMFRYDMRFNANVDIAETSQSIGKGSLFHELLRFYYLGRGGLFEGVGEDNVTYNLEPLEPYPARDQAVVLAREKIPGLNIAEEGIIDCIATFHEYVDRYASEKWKVLNVEAPFSVILYENDNPLTVRGVMYSGVVILWEGIIDLEVESDSGQFPVDHKTSSRRNYPEELNNQFLGYAFAKKSKIVVVNQIEFKKDKDKFHRPFLNYPNFLVDQWVESVIDAVYEKLIPAIKKDYWSRNHHACNQKFTCVFNDFCKADSTTRKWLMQTKYQVTKPWDPFNRDD